MPPLVADERTSLEGWLDFYRATLAQKCEELPEGQLREASAAPSTMTLLGLVQHAAAVERNWFRRVLAQEDVPPLFAPADEGGGGAMTAGSSLPRMPRTAARWRCGRPRPGGAGRTARPGGSTTPARSWAAR
ncbi:hypothetical protein Smic_25310 [Streptomyces microflavus]|uniref:Mini-circle protein n=1 Tax=Streptomyces microflavus TaxID=1919 RepID=A0A7J0CQK2_STRMI|nr:hypothetical protein Smic_25310 [Streptomyces microflavus]